MTETVTIPKAEYDRLVEAAEDLGDILACDDARRRLDSDEEEAIPAEYVYRMVNGESPVRVFRDLRGLTQSALASAAGVNRVQIADIEAGRKTGSVAPLSKLAAALNVPLDDLAP